MIHLLPSPLLSVPDVERKRSILLDNLKTTFKAIGGDKAKLLEFFIDLNECKNGATTEIVRSLVQRIDFENFSLSPSDLQAISSTMKQCKYLKSVDLHECNLNEEKMAILWKTLMQSDLKFNELNVGNNTELGPKGMKLVGKLIKTQEVKVLHAWNCNMKSEHVEGLAEGLGDAIIDYLYLSDYGNKPPYTRSLLNLLKHVREELSPRWWKINERQQEEIQNELNKIGSPTLTVIVGGGPFTDLKASQIKSKSGMHEKPSTSGTIPMSSIVPVSGVIIAKDEAKIVTGNLGSIVAVESKNVLISKEGGKIEVGGCTVKFFPGSFDDVTKVYARAEIDSSKWPTKYICITAMLWVDSQRKLLTRASVAMKSWCMKNCADSRKIYVDVLHLSKNSDKWDVVARLPLNDQKVFYFECTDFSPYILGVHEDEIPATDLVIEGRVFAGNENFSFVFFLQHDLIEKYVEDKMNKQQCQMRLIFTPIPVKMEDKISATLICMIQAFRFPKEFKKTFKIDHEFVRLQKKAFFNSLLVGASSSAMRIPFECEVQKNDSILDGEQYFYYEWRPFQTVTAHQDPNVMKITTEIQGAGAIRDLHLLGAGNIHDHRQYPENASSQKQSSEQPIVRDVNINIHGQNTDNDQKQTAVRDISVKIEGSHTDNKKQNITAGHMYMEDSKTELHQSGTSTSVATSSASTSQ